MLLMKERQKTLRKLMRLMLPLLNRRSLSLTYQAVDISKVIKSKIKSNQVKWPGIILKLSMMANLRITCLKVQVKSGFHCTRIPIKVFGIKAFSKEILKSTMFKFGRTESCTSETWKTTYLMVRAGLRGPIENTMMGPGMREIHMVQVNCSYHHP